MRSDRRSALFLGALRPGVAPPPAADLERELADFVASGVGAWASLELDEAAFLTHVAERYEGGDLHALRAADLYLACACGLGAPAALNAFEALYLSQIDAAVARLRGDGTLLDEVKQALREKLFMGVGGRPKVLDYGGRGDLASWVRVAAVRTGLNLLRSRKGGAALDEEAALASATVCRDPELEILKAQYRREFAAAFAEAVAALSVREKNLLYQNHVDGLSMEEIGRVYRVHRITIVRWIGRARGALVARTRDAMMARLGVVEAEADSILRLIRSQLDVSIRGFLCPPPD